MGRRLSKRFPWLLALCIGGHSLAAFGSGPLQGEIRFARALDEPVWVGQEVELHLELWSDGFSFGDQLLILPEVPGGFLLQADSSTVKLSETRAGAAWQGLRYTLLFYPQSAGRLEVPAFAVSYSARAGFGSAPTAFSFRTEPLGVDVRLPPGASSGDLLVTTTAFELEARWDRDPPAEGALRLQTGDALTLEVRRRAASVPGMVFAPLPVAEVDGLGVFPANPEVQDQVNRGELIGTRTDRLTIVCEAAGRYVIPEFLFQWWDPGEQRLSEKVIPELVLEVESSPVWGNGAAPIEAPTTVRLPWPILLVGLALLSLIMAWRWPGSSRPVTRLLGWWRRRVAASRQPGRRTGRLLPLNPSANSVAGGKSMPPWHT
jgi:hypothetical protein